MAHITLLFSTLKTIQFTCQIYPNLNNRIYITIGREIRNSMLRKMQ